MNRQRTLAVIFLAACVPGCGRQSGEPTDDAANRPAHPTLQTEESTLTPIDNVATVTEETLRAAEKQYGCQLPGDYRKFLLETNGGFPSPDCVTFTEAGQKTAADLFCFFAISDERPWASMEWHHDTFSGRLPKDTLPIARDSCGNLWLLSVDGDASGSVYFWEPGSYDTFDETNLNNWPRVAASFQEFRDSLGVYDASDTNDVVLSRYALTKQAADGMKENEADFTTRANPGFVWHCVCDDKGNVTMEFVKYEIHATVIHTSGYSRLRAFKGLIKEGQTRLPE